MISRSDYRTLVNRGRKAGLNTGQIYQAIAARAPEGGEPTVGQTDGNGFMTVYDQHGQRTYCPAGDRPRQ